jgi:hypothetical protein
LAGTRDADRLILLESSRTNDWDQREGGRRLNRESGIVRTLKQATAFLLTLGILLIAPLETKAYSVTSHQAIIDSAWDASIKPVILKKFPKATEEEIQAGKAYAYGGAAT